MPRIDLAPGNDSEAVRLLSLQPDMGKAIATLSDAIYTKSGLNLRVREAIRMRVAQINSCQMCLNFRFPELEAVGVDNKFYAEVETWKESKLLNDEEKLAVEYAERFIIDHLNIDEPFFQRLKENFSSKEIFEMTTTIAGLLANGRILQVLQVDQSCAV